VVVVTGRAQAEVRRRAEGAGALVVENPEPGEGPITSLRLALAALGSAVEGIALLPVDHPAVRPETVAALLQALAEGDAPLILPTFHGRRGHPVVFRRSLFPELLDPRLEGGARTVVHRHLDAAHLVELDDPGILADIDTPEAYRARFRALDAATSASLRIEAVASGAATAAVLAVAPADVAGRRLLLVLDPESGERVHGTLGVPALDESALTAARAALANPRHEDALVALADGVEAYLEIRRPVPDLIVVGAGHIALPMARIGAELGFRVWVVDDRPEFATRERFPTAHRVVRADFSDPFREVPLHRGTHVLLVTRGHKYDYDCLVKILRHPVRPAYIGMIGSRRRVRATFLQLLDDGVPKERLSDIHAPVGLDIGAETPEEIAVAVAAELVKVRRGGTGASLRDLEHVAERFFPEAEGA
jgi:xanthine dehydrogenase accessory factor